MKKTFTLLCALGALAWSVQAQTIPNASFENWTDVDLPEAPDGWNTSNALASFASGQAVATKSNESSSGNFSVRLETIAFDGDVLPGGVAMGELPTESGGFPGGMPYTDTPDSIIFDFKCDLAAGDSAVMLVIFKSNGTPLSFAQYKVGGQVANFTQLKAPINFFQPFPPDTVYLLALSSDPSSGFSQAGGWVMFDNIRFTGTNNQLINNDFENWSSPGSFLEPDDWTSFNEGTIIEGNVGVTRSTDAQEGTYAIQVETIESELFDTIGVAALGRFGEDGIEGGFPISSKPAKLSGYYKYSTPGNDSALVGVFLSFNGDVVDSSLINLPPAANYTPFELNIIYSSGNDPDTMGIAIASSDIEDGDESVVTVGSILLVDNLSFGPTTGVADYLNAIRNLSIYPNPVQDQLSLEFDPETAGAVEVHVFDLTGKLVSIQSFRAVTSGTQTFEVKTNSLQDGIYTFKVKAGARAQSGKFFVTR